MDNKCVLHGICEYLQGKALIAQYTEKFYVPSNPPEFIIDFGQVVEVYSMPEDALKAEICAEIRMENGKIWVHKYIESLSKRNLHVDSADPESLPKIAEFLNEDDRNT